MSSRRHHFLFALFLSLLVSLLLLIYLFPSPIPSSLHLQANTTTRQSAGVSQSSIPGIHYEKKSLTMRQNMSECAAVYGNVIIFIAVGFNSIKTHYRVAQKSLECYLKSTNYTLKIVHLDHDERVRKYCEHHKQFFFKKHCAAAAYLETTDWMLVLDADTGVVNPNHCIEEWIDTRVDLLFYERFFNYEIAAGNYIARNSKFAYDFLMKWASYEWKQPNSFNGADNGVLHYHLLETLLPEAVEEMNNCKIIWSQAKDYESYLKYVICVRIYLGAKRLWPGQIRIYRRAHGPMRDGFITSDKWCERDFMLHGWKVQNVGENNWDGPFMKILNPSECAAGSLDGWHYRQEKRVTVEEIRRNLASFENHTGVEFPAKARIIPLLILPEIGRCYPKCDENT